MRIIGLALTYVLFKLVGAYWEISQGLRYRRYCRPQTIDLGARVKTVQLLQAWWSHLASYEDLLAANPNFSKLSVMYVLSHRKKILEDYLRMGQKT